MAWTYKCNGEIIKAVEVIGWRQYKITDKASYQWERKEDAEDFLVWIGICNDASNIKANYEIVELVNKKEAENAQAAHAVEEPLPTEEA